MNTTTPLAALRRMAIATAAQVWISTDPGTEEADIAFEATLLAAQIITEDDIVEAIDSTDPVMLVVDLGEEAIEINVQTGCAMRGMKE